MSDPIFEASVRLQADVSDFEKQAQASVKRVLDSIEQQTQAAIRGSQQKVAQAAQLAQQQVAAPPRAITQAALATPAVPPGPPPTVPVQMQLLPPDPPFPVVTVPPVEVQMQLVPPPLPPPGGVTADVPPVPVATTITPPDEQDVENVDNLMRVILGDKPVAIPTELVPPPEPPPITVPPVEVPVSVVTPTEAELAIPNPPPIVVPTEVVPPVVPPATDIVPVVVPTEVTPPVVPPSEASPITVPTLVEPPVVPPAPPGDPVIYPAEVELPVVPPVPQQPPVVIPVEVELANIGAEIGAATQKLADLRTSGEAAARELETVGDRIKTIGELRSTVPERVFQTQPEAEELRGLEQRAAELQKQIALEHELAEATRERIAESAQAAESFRPTGVQVPPQLSQTIEQARALASRPIDFTIESNAAQFKQETADAFATAIQQAQQFADETGRLADEATASRREAVDAALSSTGDDRLTRGAEARIKIALDKQATALKKAADDAVRDLQGAAADAVLRPSQELQTLSAAASVQAETAGLLGDEATQAAKALEAERLAALSGAEGAAVELANLRLAAQSAEGAEAKLIQAKIDNLVVAAEKARAEAERLRQEASQPIAPGGPGGGAPGGPEGGRRGLGRFSELLGEGELARQIRSFARFGVGGFAFAAAFQGLGELQKELRVTGDEAFSTQGRLRNLGAELVTGNLVGGIRALLAEGGTAGFTQGLDERIKALEASRSATAANTITEEELISKYREGGDALKEFLDVQLAFGKISFEEAVALDQVAKSMSDQERAATDATAALADYTRAIARAGSESVKFGREGGPEAARGLQLVAQGVQAGTGIPGQVVGQQQTGIPRPIVTQPFPNPVFREQDPQIVADIRESLAQRNASEEERLRAELQSARITQEQKRTAFENAKNAKEAAERSGDASEEAQKAAAAYRDLVVATTGVATAATAVREQAEAARQASQAAGNQVRQARISTITDPQEQAQASLRASRIEENQARAAFERAKSLDKSQREINEAYAAWQVAAAATVGVQNQIKADAEAAAKEQAEIARTGREQNLENNIAKAALTQRKSDDKAAFDAAIDYWVSVRDSAENVAERQAAVSRLITLREGRRQALAPAADDGLRAQQLQNQLAAAQLAGNLPQQQAAAAAIVKYWQGQVDALTGVQKAQAQASLIAAKGTEAQIAASRVSLEEQKLQNRLQAAKLTPDLGDDKRRADDIVAFWERQVKLARGADKVSKQASLIAAKLARQGLEQQATSGGGDGFSIVDALNLSQRIFRDFAGNIQPLGSAALQKSLFPGFAAPPRDLLRPPSMDAGIQRPGDRFEQTASDLTRAILEPGGIGADIDQQSLKIEEDSRDELRAIRRLLERNGTGATVTVNQNMRTPDPAGFAQAHWARFAMEEAFNG